MSTPLFFPIAAYVSRLSGSGYLSLRTWCEQAGIRCQATGPFAERPIRLRRGRVFSIVAEAAPSSRVEIEIPRGPSAQAAARLLIAALAYSLMDVVARQSIRGVAWARLSPGAGRPRTGRAKTNRERQRELRQRRLLGIMLQ